MGILAPVNDSKETRVAVAARSAIVLSTMNTIVKNNKDTKKCYTQCGMFCGQRNSLKQWLSEQLECLTAAWFKQDGASNVVISGSFIKEKALCIATRSGIKDFRAPEWLISGSNQQHTVVYKTILDDCRSVDSSTVYIWRKKQLLKAIDADRCKNIYNAHETGLFFTLPCKKF